MNKDRPRPILTVSDGDTSIRLRYLTLIQLKRIDALVEDVGDFGEVRLIVERGTVKFAEIVVSKKI